MTRRLWCASLVALFIAPLLFSRSALAAPPDPTHLDASVLVDPGWTSPDPTAPVTVLVEINGPTTLDLYRAANYKVGDKSAPAQQFLDGAFDDVATRQAPARAAILASGAEIIDTYDTAMNGFLVRATKAQVDAFSGAPGVVRVYRAPLYYPTLAHAVPMIGADEVAEHLGFTGKDVNIAIIDTGIDYTHKNLGGSGDPKDYQDVVKNADKPAPGKFPNAKVIGGWDFAGTDYTGGNTPKPDANPIDEAGHGSHVSGIAAGSRENLDKVYHGVAPDANLIALKVFGARGGTNLSDSAIEWAIEANLGKPVSGKAARVDVINMSLGSPWASNVQNSVGVVRRAVEAGIAVVVAAGNDGDVSFIAGSPCATPQALCVASVVPTGQPGDQVQVVRGGVTENIEALAGSPQLSTTVAESGKITAPLAIFGRGCGGDTVNGAISGKIALIERGGCSFAQKLFAAQQFSPVGALIFSDADDIVVMGLNNGEPKANIPAFMIQRADGLKLRQQLQQGMAIDGVLDPALLNSKARDYLGDVISDFSSRGPARNGEFKPNLSAPGSRIFAPRMGSGTEGVFLDGTSMATPMVAGAAAVIVQRLRDQDLAPKNKPLDGKTGLTSADVDAFLINYAQPSVWQADNRTSALVPLARSGSGRVDLSRAARGTTLMRSGPLASINFGIVALDDTYSHDEPFTLRNLSDHTRRYKLSVEFRDPTHAGAGVKYTPMAGGNPVPRVTLNANSSASLKLRAEAAADQLLRYGLYGGLSVMNGDGRMHEAEYDAFLVATEIDDSNQPLDGGDVARLPVYLLPRGTSVLEASPSPIKVDPTTQQGPVILTNGGGQPGRAELYALWAEDPVENTVNAALNIDQVGIRMEQDANRQRVVDFAIHTAGARGMPFESQLNVYLDTDTDPAMDYQIYNTDLGAATVRRYNGEQAVVVLDIAANRGTVRYFAGADLNNRILTLPVLAADIGFDGTTPVSFNAVLQHVAVFDATDPDVVPDGGITNGKFGTPRLAFNEGDVGFGLDRWSADVPAAGSTVLQLTGKDVSASSNPLARLLALYPQNLQRRDDSQILTFEPGELPTVEPSPTPRITDTPAPTATSIEPPVNTPVPTALGATATATRPAIPTDSGPLYYVYLPVGKKD